MNVIKTKIDGLVIIEPKLFVDERGYFSYGVLRGLHFQLPPYSQSKLVRVIEGKVLDVAVDLRKSSPTYGQYVSVELTADNHRQFFIPKGFAHGFVVLSQQAVFQYKCDEFYHPEAEGAIAWNDPTINIDWQIPAEDIILSAKDKIHPMLHDIASPF